jgi:hypothetical protein
MSAIRFQVPLYSIDDWTILRLPQSASAQLPSRGQVMVKGTIKDLPFQTALEPDGAGSHWLHVTKAMQQAAGVQAGDTVTLAIESTKDWPEPEVPADVQHLLVDNPTVTPLWTRITPMARWEWLRWIGSTGKDETRKHRIEVSCSKLRAGERRPCCFNRNMCCVPQVSKNGVLRPAEDAN